MLLEICFIGLKHTIKPRQEFMSTVIGMHHNGTIGSMYLTFSVINGMRRYLHSVRLGHESNVVGCAYRTSNRGLLFIIGKTFSSKIGSTTLRNLDNDR